WPTYEFARDELAITTPALQITDAWRAAALPAGIAFMIGFALLRLTRAAPIKAVALSLGLVALFVGLFWLSAPLFRQLGNFNLLIFFVGVVAATVFAGVPIAFAFGLAIFGYLALATHTPLMVLIGRMDEGMSHLILLAVPLFVFLGLLIEMTGMARAMVAFLASLLGHVRGGLHYVLVAGMYLVSGISGSKAADMAAVAPVLFPEMKARGAKPGDLVALLSATGAQTETVPPSLVLITIGSVTGVSIAALFTGGPLPAGVLACLLCFVIRWRHQARNRSKFHCRTAGACVAVSDPGRGGRGRRHSDRGFDHRHCLFRGRGPRRLPALRLGGPATDAGFHSLPVWRDPPDHRHGDGNGLRSHAIRFLPYAAAMTNLPGGATSFMAASIVAFVVLGSVLEGIPAIVLFGPLLFPIAKAVGIHEVHYAMAVILAMGIGLFAPPFGVGYYAA